MVSIVNLRAVGGKSAVWSTEIVLAGQIGKICLVGASNGELKTALSAGR